MDNVLDLVGERFEYLSLPEKYQELWDNINLPIQSKKAAHYMLPEVEKQSVLTKLSKRAYYLTTIAEKFGAKNIVEVGTAEGWQFYSFAEYCKENGGKVWSCDVEDKHNKKYQKEYESVSHFIHGDSAKLAEQLEKENVEIDLFYIDGSHEAGAVLRDIKNLKPFQSTDKMPIWIFDDFDERFGCYKDISMVAKASPQYFVYSPGKTASNNPTHQLVVKGYFQ